MKNDWAPPRGRLVEKFLHPRRVVADCGVDTEPRTSQERETSAHAISDRANLARERRLRLERRDRRADISDSILVIKALTVIARDLDVLRTEAEFDARLEPPKQIGRERHVSIFRPSIGDRADMSVDPEDFLQH